MYNKNPYLTYEKNLPNLPKNISSTDDRIYYNISIPSTTIASNPSPAIFQQELNEAIIQKPSDYYLAIIRFTIPTQDIPIMVAQIQPFPNTNINNTIYSVTLTYQTFTSGQIFVQYVTQNPNALVLPLSASHPNADNTLYYYIYTYTAFLNMINTALQTAFTALNVAVPGGLPVGSVAPYFQFDTFTERISLVAQIANYDITIANPIKIFVNYQLFTFIDGLPFIFEGITLPGGKDVQLLVENNKNNWYNPPYLTIPPPIPPVYYIMTQEYNTISDWNSFKSLQLVSNILPIKSEYVPVVSQINQSIVNSQGILKDFEPLIELGPEARTTVQYQLQSPYQLINLTSDIPLTKIDVRIYWTDQYGFQTLLSIPFNQVVTIKMVFIKKSTFTS